MLPEFINQGSEMFKLLTGISNLNLSTTAETSANILTQKVTSAELRIAFTPLCDRPDMR